MTELEDAFNRIFEGARVLGASRKAAIDAAFAATTEGHCGTLIIQIPRRNDLPREIYWDSREP